ncbi:NF041680 family putative transposase [Saccharothrix carnea]|uniref:NF041680 family putative transposase n=1 Tax=Saccharothrix carnea TaxID=1280637 RepID=UPI00362EDCDB
MAGFRREFHGCLTARADALFELTDAVLCVDGPVVSLPELSLAGVHRRGHGAMYDALACGRVEVGRLRRALAGLVLPRAGNGGLRIAIDVTPWPRPDAECSPQRLHCHRYCRCDGVRQTIPGWPYSVAAALGSGRSSWVAPLDVRRIGPDDDVTDVTAAQVRGLVARLREAGQLREGDPPVLIVLDSGYDVVRLTWLLADLPVHVLGRIRSDRVMRTPPPPRRRDGRPGRPPRHGGKVRLADPDTWPAPERESTGPHARYGGVRVRAFGRLHPQLERRGTWADHPGPLPVVEATVILVQVERLAHPGAPKPLWLWSSHPVGDTAGLDGLWRAYLRRFDVEHTFRFLKQTLGLTRPRLRTPEQADRWAWLLIAAYTQLRLARHLVHDLRRPWDKPLSPDGMTPGRVRRGFRRIRRAIGNPASAPKPGRPGPGRPKGSLSTPAPRHPVGKKQPKPETIRRNQYKKAHKAKATG